MTDYVFNDLNADQRGLVNIKSFYIGGVDAPEMYQLTPKEIILGESLLTPGLQTVVTFQNSVYLPSGKNFDKFKGQPLSFSLQREYVDPQGHTQNFTMTCLDQTVYRMDNRGFKPTNVSATEEFSIHACDPTLLSDAKHLMSKSWKCANPTNDVAAAALECVGAKGTDIEQATKPRDYIAENIHPFQVINQQCNVALNQMGVPDFVHYMTYERSGRYHMHHIKSLYSMVKPGTQPVAKYYYSDTGLGQNQPAQNPSYGTYGNPEAVISMEFPCDFDILSDALNGIDEFGQDQNTVSTINPLTAMFGTSGQFTGCGIGQYNYKLAISNADTTKQQQSCNLDVETHLLKRQARMALLDRDKIALRLVVPWNSDLHVGKLIEFKWQNKYDNSVSVYGEGTYLITAMTHTIRYGGFSTTSIDCVTNTAGYGLTGRA